MSFVNVAETNQPPLVASSSISTKEDATRQQKANAKAFTQYERVGPSCAIRYLSSEI